MPYNVNEAWPATQIESRDSLLNQMQLLGPNPFFHGTPNRKWDTIKGILDIRLKESPPGLRLDIEKRLIDTFVDTARVHLLPEARRHLEDGHLEWRTYCHTGSMYVGRHFGLPTRAVDWTRCPRVAAFFACRRFLNLDGVIWWVNGTKLEEALANQWPSAYGVTENVLKHIERDFINRIERDVLYPVHFPPYMKRASRQKAFIIMSGKFGTDHAHKMHSLGVIDCGRIVIPSRIKRDVIEWLDYLGINGHSLGLGDSTCETLATDAWDAL